MGEGAEALSGALPAGAVIADRYRIEGELGRGATGNVYRVQDERSGRKLALKRLSLADQTRAALNASQFEREFYTLCQLAHPRIIEVYDYGVDGESAFYTMELLDGQDLREHKRLPWREACALLCDVASSLAILHSRRLLHRDVSARNVRCTADGRAKLIDFGAMTPMGVSKHCVGTPPFVPPEALQLQALDARADLYALGSLAYYVLTGRYAYHARSFDQLVELWRTPPPAVSALAPDVPHALDRLVMQLLHLDRAARPRSAAEVMERLSGIAGLPLDEHAEVKRAYLVAPTLVGRESIIDAVRETLAAAQVGRGTSVLIEGASGSGRSRVLDACVLEARLLGAAVLRADAADRAGGDYGVAHTLCEQLFETLPELAERCAQPHRAQLDQLLAGHPLSPSSASATQRRELHNVLVEFLLAVAARKHLVIAIDDAETIDEPSAAVIAALALDMQGRKLSLLLALDTAAPPVPALLLMRGLARTLTLEPLRAEQTAALLRGLFGDEEHVDAIAERIHELSEGSPRFAMALAERLVERGVARYEAGSWSLPAELAPGDLPDSLQAALAARIAALPEDARALAEALALTDPAVLALERYPLLDAHGERGRTFRAIDDLLSASVLVPAGDRYRFAQRELAALLQAGLTLERERELHARIARAVEACEDPILVPHHLMLAGREREAIERLAPLRTDDRAGFSTRGLSLLERALPAAERLRLPSLTRTELHVWLVDNAANLGDYARFTQYGPPLLEQLYQQSGIPDYLALDPALPPGERLTAALTAAQRRYEAAPESERGLPPAQAIPLFARVCAIFGSMAGTAKDLALVENLPSLAPLAPLSPALALVDQMSAVTLAAQCGRFEDAYAGALAVLDRVRQPDRAGLDPLYFKTVYLGYLYLQGTLAASHGQPSTPAWIAELEHEPGHRVNALRVRMTHLLMQGDMAQARECQRRAELLQLQDGNLLRFPGTSASIEIHAYSYADDLIGVKRVTERMEQLALRYPRWQPTLGMARAMYRMVQGDAAGALEAITAVLRSIEPGRHVDWAMSARTHVLVLNRLGRFEEAAELGTAYLRTCLEHRLLPSHRGVMRALAEALTGAGRLEEARQMADDCIAENVAAGVRGLILGIAYETRARVALAMGDQAVFQHFAALCATEYRRGENPALSAKYERLIRDAADAGLDTTAISLFPIEVFTSSTAANEVHARLLAHAGASRAHEALRTLVEASAAQAGFLFVVRDGRVLLQAATDATEVPEGWHESIAHYVRDQLSAGAELTALDFTSGQPGTPAPLFDHYAREFEPVFLGSKHEGGLEAAVAVLHCPGERREPTRALREAVAAALTEHESRGAVTCVA